MSALWGPSSYKTDPEGHAQCLFKGSSIQRDNYDTELILIGLVVLRNSQYVLVGKKDTAVSPFITV